MAIENQYKRMHDKVLIRNYRDNDRNSVLHLFRLNSPQFFSPGEESDLIFYLDHEIEYYFVLELDRTVVGCGGFNLSEDSTRGTISWDIIHPDFQGKSLGSLLLNYRIAALKKIKGIDTITVRTSQFAYQFYQKSGFKLVEHVKDYWAKGFDLYRMETTVF